MTRQWGILALAGGLLLLSCLDATAAVGRDPDEEKGDILVDLNVNYRLGYRDGTWVPVDVVIANTLRDVEGYVELRTYNGDQLQSPIYRVPAQSPKSSKKRFRFHCQLKRATRLEAMLYHKNRAVLPVPSWLTLQPISPQDLLGLVLDDEPTDYGFLNAVFAEETVAAAEDRSVRFYREEVPKRAVHLLADYPQCYEPYDVIILGDAEPQRISPRHRVLLERYVLEGGILVICTGENAPAYRGTWVEDLAGATIGSAEPLNEVALAERVFRESDRVGAKPSRNGRFAKLTPTDPAARVRGEEATLAILRPLGSGFVVTVAVDAASHVLQDTAGYKRLWFELCSYRGDVGDLHYDTATQLYMDRLPQVSGIRLFSKGSVMLYLFLYFAVGIVGNWLVCNALKRRELAWLFLVVFSAGFTVYAMVFGTAGRAKSTRVEQIEVLRVSREGGASEIRSAVSVITARTSRLSLALRNEYSLAEDEATYNPVDRALRYGAQEVRPFYLTQGPSPRIDQFMVGASELRLLRVHTETQVPGGIEGQLSLDDRGLHGTLTNRTGLELVAPFVLFNGTRYPAQVTADEIVIEPPPPRPAVEPGEAEAAAIERGQRLSLAARRGIRGARGAAAFGSRGNPLPASRISRNAPRPPPGRGEDFRDWEERERRQLYEDFLNSLFAGSEYDAEPTQLTGPFLVAWVKDGPLGTIEMDASAEDMFGATVLIADVEVSRSEGDSRTVYRAIPVGIDDTGWKLTLDPDGVGAMADAFTYDNPLSREPLSVEIMVPPLLRGHTLKDMLVRVDWAAPGGQVLAFSPRARRGAWAQAPVAETPSTYVPSDDLYRGSRTYRIENWRNFWDEKSGVLAGTVRPENQTYDNRPIEVLVSAKLLTTTSLLESEDWKPWP